MKIAFFALSVAFAFSLFARSGTGCGILTHIEVAFRALEHFNQTYKGLDIRSMVRKHPDALQAGAVFPDSFYNEICEGGIYHDVSESAHWTEFVIPALDYFKQQYDSKPIDTAGEKLLTFLLGVMSHDLSDVTWHSLGIDQGFIKTMSHVNFFGNFGDAHSAADTGGDIVNRYELAFPTTTSLFNFQWYVPAKDVVNIFKSMGIDFPEKTVRVCASLMMKIAGTAEAFAISKGYAYMAAKSPFLGSALNDFFHGGMNEMAAWVLQRWLTIFMYLENSQNCRNTQHSTNPLYWVCDNQPPIKPPEFIVLEPSEYDSHREHREKMQAFQAMSNEVGDDHTEIKVKSDSFGGIYLEGSAKSTVEQVPKPAVRQTRGRCAVNDYYLKKAYSTVGQTLLSADVNLDGYDDLIVGVPGYSFDNRFHEGRVFVIFGGKNGVPQSNVDLEKADIIFPAPFTGPGRFGYSVAVLDFNGDGQPDIAISAPIYAPDIVNAMYSGQAYVYYGRPDGTRFDTTLPDITIDCGKRYCNFGTTLSIGDVDRDGKDDLIIGSPYASLHFDNLRQNGFVVVYYSGKQRPSNIKALDKKSSDIFLPGEDPFSWFGYSAITTSAECNLLIGAPARKLTSPDNVVMQMSGSVYCYNVEKEILRIFANGTRNFENFGSSLAFGYPNGRNSDPVVAITAAHDDTTGYMTKVVPYPLTQSGSVYLYGPKPGSTFLGQLGGDRHFGRFGQVVKFVNYNNDGFDDLLIGAPLRPTHLTVISLGGEAVGEMYLYYGKTDFVKELVNRRCPILSTFYPCPEDHADKVFAINENKAQFGSNAAVIRFGNKAQIIISASRTDDYARQSGKLVLFSNDC